jgi:hypothetical protein
MNGWIILNLKMNICGVVGGDDCCLLLSFAKYIQHTNGEEGSAQGVSSHRTEWTLETLNIILIYMKYLFVH